MKNCPVCNNPLSDTATYCPVCTAEQTPVSPEKETDYNSIFLKVLCILTIIGSSFGLISIPVSLSLTEDYPAEKLPEAIIGLTMVLSLIKIAAAVMMLKKKLLGLHIYTGAAVVALGQALYMIIAANETNITGLLSGVLDIGVIIVFLIMYWLPVNRRQLA